jgi:hypothetical protein
MLEVEEIKIKLPSMSHDAARNLGEAVANRLMLGIPDSVQSGAIGSIQVRLNIDEGLSEGKMAEQIAGQILKELKFL